MAYDYGSESLGIRNPFKTEGLLRAIRGFLVSMLGIYPLLQVASIIKQDQVLAWIYAAIGFVLLAAGLRALGSGIFQMLRFFVGRSVPTSLATNYSKSERETAKLEQPHYKSNDLEEMLMGRKNKTFVEPEGFISRLVHTLVPKLIFLPYPLRNLAQRFAGAIIATAVALVAYALTAFVCITGLAGNTGDILLPFFSFFLIVYLIMTWRTASTVSRQAERQIESQGNFKLVKIIAFAILAPVLLGVAINQLLQQRDVALFVAELQGAELESLAILPQLLLVMLFAAISGTLTFLLLKQRTAIVKAQTKVSEYRANWQENIHPRELFVNIDNIVMANRRYKEIPNRVYRELAPKLNEQSASKGDFSGEVIIETQPAYTPIEHTKFFKQLRLWSTILGQIFLVIGPLILFYLLSESELILKLIREFMALQRPSSAAVQQFTVSLFNEGQFVIALLFSWLICSSFGRLLENFSHTFWAELNFDSLLVYLKCEGTYTESKLTTGKGIYDSTSSENYVMRSSLTPWIITSRIMTSTFADSGSKNVEHPRHILEMVDNPEEMQAILDDIQSFLSDRETIASIRNSQDLSNTERIFQINQQSRAMPVNADQGTLASPQQDADASFSLDKPQN
ncbi:hypothetical protein GCM10010919_18780 [Alishewanella longhuensis]|uniref:Uncharacterized protein n=1 Tax=Alishewanella longhuensis TaxID=1091037 RepID=A0ABQ3KXU8_9ALTE|nr:hypothetical protein [Alishewanella longhuensis]GHG69120.1 hypothetical protein GCM10010919_18780 [Alishewanella longhuensis]